jgi:hypothetical protein
MTIFLLIALFVLIRQLNKVARAVREFAERDVLPPSLPSNVIPMNGVRR